MNTNRQFLSSLWPLAVATSLVFGGAVSLPGASGATNAAPLHLTLAQAIEEAVRANPGLKASGHQTRAAENEASAASRSRWGTLNAVGSYSYLNDDQIIRPMSRELLAGGFAGAPWDRSQAHYGLSYEIPLYLGGRLNNQIHIARLEARKSAELLEGTRWQVRFNVVSLYSSLQALDEAGAAFDAQITALAQTKTNLDEMVALGRRPEVDRLKVIEELEAARAARANVAADRRKVASLLLSVLGRDPAGDVTVDAQDRSAGFQPAGSPASSRPNGEMNGTLDDAQPARIGNPRASRLEVCATNSLPASVNDNSAIRAARLALEQADRSIRVARGEFLPKVVASANAFENTGTRIDRTEETWGATVAVVFPLFEGGVRFSKVKAAREKQAAAEESLRQVELQTLAAWQDALGKFEAARANLEAAAARVAASAEAARIEQVRYDTGAGSIEDLLRARSREAGARAALASARADLVIAAERLNTLAEKEVVP